MKKIEKLLTAIAVILVVGIIFIAKDSFSQNLGSNVINLQTDNARAITATDAAAINGGVFTALDVSMPNGIRGSIMSNPSDGAVDNSTASGTLVADIFYFKLTTLDDDGGETPPSDEFSCTTLKYDACTFTFTVNALATSHRLWVSTTSESYSYGYVVATSSTQLSTTTSTLTAGTIPTYNSAYNDAEVFEGGRSLTTINTNSAVIKASAGTVHTVTFSQDDAAPTAGSIYLYDSATAASSSGEMFQHTFTTAVFNPTTIVLDADFTSGLYIEIAATADVNVTTTYK